MDAAVVPVAVRLPRSIIPMLAWLTQRWDVSASSIAADGVVLMTSGRYLLSQLIENDRLPRQAESCAMVEKLVLQLLEPTAEALTAQSVLKGMSVENLAGQLLMTHLVGLLNPQLASVSVVDPSGELIRTDDESLKIWMPDAVERKIDLLAQQHELTKSDVVRNVLLLHVYGRIRYEQWTQEGSWRPKRKSTKTEALSYREGDALFSRGRAPHDDSPASPGDGRRREFIREYGKSNGDMRVFMPGLLKRSLQQLADAARIPISEYCRNTLVKVI